MALTPPSNPQKLRIAMTFDSQLFDFGWAYNCNLARIALLDALVKRHPTLSVSSTVAILLDNWSEDCHPQFNAWLEAGVDLIISTPGQQLCLSKLALAWPNTTFVVAAGSADGPPNYANVWVRFYQPSYLAGYTAGLLSKTKKVCVATPMPIAVSMLDAAGFSRGVYAADPRVQIHIFCTGRLRYPLLEVWIVNQSYALGCDVVFVQSLAIDGVIRAQELGLMTVGFFSDARLTVGENVVTSVMVNMAPSYLRVTEAMLNGTFAAQAQRADWWMGWDQGSIDLAAFSFLVPKGVQDRVLAQVPLLNHIFCGRVCTKTRCICNSSSCCLTDAQLYTLDSQQDFVHYHGTMQLPGLACRAGQLATWHLDTFTMACSDCPAGTYAYNMDQISECRPCPSTTSSPAGATACTPCPPGTYGDQPGQGQCRPCPPGSHALTAASLQCDVCLSGVASSDRTQCEAASLAWLAGVGGGVGGGLVLLTVLLVGLAKRCGKRSHRAAPRDASQPFCVLFTDIQGSTSLWATIPDIMAGALDAHHRLIRTLVARHQCYEVKTIGDSFMCVAKGPAPALRFALAVQEEFARYDWGTDRIDRAYGEMGPCLSQSPGCWNGLRIRIGIHFGHGNIK
eukprot:EG_transcript_6756